MKLKKNYFQFSIFLIFLLFALIIRSYNINSEDFWTDEIFAFFTSEPNISFKETLVRTLSSNFNCLYDFLLKFFHSLFGYDVYVSRYFSLFLSFFSLITFALLFNKVSNFNSLIFGFFILSINLFHIRYSIEVRSYILTFFLTTLFIYLNFRNEKQEEKLNLIKLIFIVFVAILMVLSHAFTLLVLGSFVLYKIIKFIKFQKFNLFEVSLVLSLILISSLYLFVYLPVNIKFADQLLGLSPHWIKQLKPSFYTNFYFSQYFGSRILGLIHLFVLFYLIYKFRLKLFREINIFTFFVILLFFSYFIPIVYGYLFSPVLISRYIMFTLIPIIFLLAHFTFQLSSKTKRYMIVILICFTSLINHIFYENTFKQFYTETYPTKPQFKAALNAINKSGEKYLTVRNYSAKEKNTNEAYINYVKKYIEKKDLKLRYFKVDNADIPKSFWVINIRDTIKKDYTIPQKLTNYDIKKNIFFNSLEIILLSR